VWDKDYKEMINSYSPLVKTWVLGLTLYGTVIGFNANALEPETDEETEMGTYPDRFKLMQYTGLTDKNKKEIYKDDIARDNKDNIIQIVWTDHFQWGCKVIHGGCLSMGLTFPLWQWDNCQENAYRTLEVIGNIWETPELLEKEK
jgi:uncharacterized phage protein (TIGR01671 family)